MEVPAWKPCGGRVGDSTLASLCMLPQMAWAASGLSLMSELLPCAWHWAQSSGARRVGGSVADGSLVSTSAEHSLRTLIALCRLQDGNGELVILEGRSPNVCREGRADEALWGVL